MALATSIPPETPVHSDKFEQMRDHLDDEIASIRAEIQNMTEQRKLLSSSLLNSTRIQDQLAEALNTETMPDETESLLVASQKHAQQNAYRLAFGVTAFPFTDPSPDTSNNRLLGIRIDLSSRHGKYDKPYYILCKRASTSSEQLRVHRHTIPVFIPLREYEALYLPLPDEGYGSGDSSQSPPEQRQDLHALVQNVRHDLVSWRLRREAIELLAEELGLGQDPDERSATTDARDNLDGNENIATGKFGVKKICATAVEARYAKIEWTNGSVGRLKISDKGTIQRTVVFGAEGRAREAERVLSGHQIGIMEVVKRLETLHERSHDDDQMDEDESTEESEDTP